MSELWIVFLPFALIFVMPLLVRRPPACPDCGSPLPAFQSPFTKTRRQWAEGGYVCERCGCETDAAGVSVAKVTGPRWGWFALAVGLPALSLVIAAALVVILIRR